MKFDSVMIGGGLAGLVCGIRLAEAGQRCAVVSAGQSALHFSSGSLDLLSALPDGTPVNALEAALPALAEQAPTHPYSLIGAQNVLQHALEAEQLLARCGLTLTGSYRENHQRVTPLGTLRSTWLSPQEIPTCAIQAALPWQRVVVAGIEGFLDFQQDLVASELAAQGIQTETAELTLPALDRLRNNPSEFRAVNIARVLDLPENLTLLAAEINQLAAHADAILMPACVGMEQADALAQLRPHLRCPLWLLPTLPPSLLGMRMHYLLRRRFQQLGGTLMPGDAVLNATLRDGRITEIYTRNHTDIPLRAANVVLASGSFFSNGLSAGLDAIREPVFNLDVTPTGPRSQWCNEAFFGPQPYLQAGVITDARLHPAQNGATLRNLYVAGAVLAGCDPIQQGCGAGVSAITGLHAARHILADAEGTR